MRFTQIRRFPDRLLSTVHRGTAFEYRALALLTKHMSMSLTRVGGSHDGGIDLLGWWWVPCENPCAYRAMSSGALPPPLKSFYMFCCVASRPPGLVNPLHEKIPLCFLSPQILSKPQPQRQSRLGGFQTRTRRTGADCASSRSAKPRRGRWAPRTCASWRASCTDTPPWQQ
jgi:hypothetical protein